ncbi:ABC transporter permease [Nocardiopsis ansamitocini]|uniref:Transport permease protein n=1 Tax=Nocardiopsis ansamitocini TaxID=1670832 RepID=A0A9W6PB70_9ACTN|nr:ABC transporter permease [Nocardiopsis ansamitocini]GLU50316.1 transport permease protein [Nocardiopsis ansamitocini]
MSVLTRAATDSGVVAHRNLLNIVRTPGSLVTGVVQPVMFVLLLAYVFGGSLGGDGYREFLIGGIFAQTLTFNASFTAIGLANDLQKGLIDRYRSLPMSRVSVILGRTLSDLATSTLSLVVTALCGLAIGWRVNNGLGDAILGFALLLFFAFAVSWIGAAIGLAARSVEVAQSLGLIWLFPVTFVSGAFVSIAAMPGPLRVIAEWNPVTAVAFAARELFGNPAPAGLPQPSGWPAENAVLYALLCSVAIIAVFAPLAMRQYRRINRG